MRRKTRAELEQAFIELDKSSAMTHDALTGVLMGRAKWVRVGSVRVAYFPRRAYALGVVKHSYIEVVDLEKLGAFLRDSFGDSTNKEVMDYRAAVLKAKDAYVASLQPAVPA